MMRWLVEGFSRQCNFDEYKRYLTAPPKKSEKTASEILANVETLMNGVKWGD